MNSLHPHLGVLLAAHGERGGSADNAGIAMLAAELAWHGVASELHWGLINGAPSIPDALRAFTTHHVVLYPLFMSEGYFARVRLPKLVADHRGLTDHRVKILRPLGVDPRLAGLIADKAAAHARARGHGERQISVVLLAHGSRRDGASRHAATALQHRIAEADRFMAVSCAFLEEAPTLQQCTLMLAGPIVVVGLFVGDGLHGSQDASRLIEELARPEVMFAGNVGNWREIAEIAAAAIRSVGFALGPEHCSTSLADNGEQHHEACAINRRR